MFWKKYLEIMNKQILERLPQLMFGLFIELLNIGKSCVKTHNLVFKKFYGAEI